MTRRRTAEGFDFLSPGRRLFWRALVVGGPPVLLLAIGFVGGGLLCRRAGVGSTPAAGTPTASSGLRWAAWGSVPVIALGFVFLDWWPGRGYDGIGTPTERVGPLLPEELRQAMVPAVLGVQSPGGEPYYFGRSEGVWRCLNYRNAVASQPAVEAVISNFLEARGTVRETDASSPWDYGLGTTRMGRLALFGPRFLQDRGRRDLIFQVDVGLQIPGRDGSFVRPSGTSEVWAVFPSLRVETDGRDDDRRPPLLDPHVIPAAWPGRAAIWRVIQVDMAPGPSFRLELSADGVEGDSESPWQWRLTTSGRVHAPFHPAAMAYSVFLRSVPHAEILDPADGEELGFLNPVGLIRILPLEGDALELTVGRNLGGNGLTLLNRTFQTAFRVDPEIAALMFPPPNWLLSTSPDNPWLRHLTPTAPFGGARTLSE